MPLDFVALRNTYPKDFEDFVNEYRNGGNPAADYYSLLRQQLIDRGLNDEADYANTARNVTLDEGLDGKFANDFSETVASDYGVDFEVGSDNWLQMQFDLLNNDLFQRQNNSIDGSLDVLQKNEIHKNAFEPLGLPAKAFSAFTPTNTLAETNPDAAARLMNELMTDNGIGDNWFTDGVLIDFLNDVNDTISLDYYGWLYDVLRTLFNNPELVSEASQNELQELLDLANVLGDDYGWAKDNPGELLNGLLPILPPWMQGLLNDLGLARNLTSPLVLDMA